jgi:hypothetical protein
MNHLKLKESMSKPFELKQFITNSNFIDKLAQGVLDSGKSELDKAVNKSMNEITKQFKDIEVKINM